MKTFKLILKLLFFFISIQAKADLPRIAYQYDLFSQNGSFYIKSIPFSPFDPTTFGKTIVYDARTSKIVYEVNNYLPRTSFISNNGKTLITTTHWLGGHSDFDKQDLITFYINGKKAKQYYINTLAPEKLTVTYTTSHSLWYEDIFLNNDTLFIWTLDEQTILLDANSGKILAVQDDDIITKRFDLKKLPRLKSTIYYDIKYPFEYPELANGANFHKSLINFLKMEDAYNYTNSKRSFIVSCAIDRKGNCQVFDLYIDEKDSKKWKLKIKSWLLRQKFKTGTIPINCDKWVFTDYIYLK